MDETVFIVQPYVAKASGLVAQASQMFGDEGSARRAAGRLIRFRAGVVVLSQRIAPVARENGRPVTLAVYGQVPAAWGSIGKAA